MTRRRGEPSWLDAEPKVRRRKSVPGVEALLDEMCAEEHPAIRWTGRFAADGSKIYERIRSVRDEPAGQS